MRFIQGNVISSDYIQSMNTYIMYLDRNLKKLSKGTYILHINRIFKSMYHYNKNLVIQYIVHDWLRYSSLV